MNSHYPCGIHRVMDSDTDRRCPWPDCSNSPRHGRYLVLVDYPPLPVHLGLHRDGAGSVTEGFGLPTRTYERQVGVLPGGAHVFRWVKV